MMNKQRLGMVLVLTALAIAVPLAVYAQTDENPSKGIISTIFTDEVVLLSIGVTVTGVTFKAVIALLKVGRKNFDPRMTLVSFLLGFLVSIHLVAGSIQHLPVDAAPVAYLLILAGEVATVAGIDGGAKSVGRKLGVTNSQ